MKKIFHYNNSRKVTVWGCNFDSLLELKFAKPRAYTGEKELILRRQVAENYIRQKGYDWEFRIIYDDEIKLTLDHLVQFNECCCFLIQSSSRKKLAKFQNRSYCLFSCFPSTLPDRKRIQFVMFGEPEEKGFLKNE